MSNEVDSRTDCKADVKGLDPAAEMLRYIRTLEAQPFTPMGAVGTMWGLLAIAVELRGTQMLAVNELRGIRHAIEALAVQVEPEPVADSTPVSFNYDACVAELRRLEAEEGVKLPATPEVIAQFERLGYVMDFQTGEIFSFTDLERGDVPWRTA